MARDDCVTFSQTRAPRPLRRQPIIVSCCRALMSRLSAVSQALHSSQSLVVRLTCSSESHGRSTHAHGLREHAPQGHASARTQPSAQTRAGVGCPATERGSAASTCMCVAVTKSPTSSAWHSCSSLAATLGLTSPARRRGKAEGCPQRRCSDHARTPRTTPHPPPTLALSPLFILQTSAPSLRLLSSTSRLRPGCPAAAPSHTCRAGNAAAPAAAVGSAPIQHPAPSSCRLMCTPPFAHSQHHTHTNPLLPGTKRSARPRRGAAPPAPPTCRRSAG